jgi:HK97 family phage portal protein
MRLVDAVRTANYLPEDANLWQSWIQQTYGKPVDEQVLQTFQSYAQLGYGGNGVVFGLMLARAMLFSEATFKWQNLTTRDLFGNQDLRPLEAPWPNGTTGELLVRMIQDADLAGNAFIRNDGDRLVRLRPDWVDFVLVGSGEEQERTRWDVLGYTHWLNGPGSEREFYPVEEVAHWSPIPDPMSTYRGMSWLTPVVREINADLAMTDYKRRFMDNSATPNLLVKYQQKLTPGALARVREVWNDRYGGTDGLKTAILDSGADVTVIGQGLQALDFANVQGAGENRIAVAAGVPGIVAGLKEGLEAATYSNYEQAMRRFADITMRPLWRSACACLASILTVPPGAKLWYDTTDIAALRQGEKDRAESLQINAITANTLITAGYEPASVTKAIVAGDMTLLVHTGLVSVQLQKPGTETGAIIPTGAST